MELFKLCGREVTRLWTEHLVPSSPHQELIIWLGVLRAPSARRPEFMALYPDEEWLHP